MPEYLQIATTVEKKEDGYAIARALLEKRLAACVQVSAPMTSIYWWQGEIQQAGEYLCLIKSRRELYPEVEAAVKEMHPYEMPEIVATPIVAGSPEYLAWIATETAGVR